MTNLSDLLLDRGDVEGALQLRLRVIEIDQTILPEAHQNQVTNRTNLAHLYKQAGQTDRALATYGEALEQIRRHGNTHFEPLAWRGIGDVHRNAGDAAAARAAYTKALAISRSVADDLDASFSLMRLGTLERRVERPRQAELYLRQALAIRQTLPDADQASGRSRAALTRADLGACLLDQGRRREAVIELCESRRVLREIHGPEDHEVLAVEDLLRELGETCTQN
ncbi:MAG: tetratricopeptide repeat protein [Acidobacteriota bacterium]